MSLRDIVAACYSCCVDYDRTLRACCGMPENILCPLNTTTHFIPVVAKGRASEGCFGFFQALSLSVLAGAGTQCVGRWWWKEMVAR